MPFMEEMVRADSNWDEMLQQAPAILAAEVILTRPDSLSSKPDREAVVSVSSSPCSQWQLSFSTSDPLTCH